MIKRGSYFNDCLFLYGKRRNNRQADIASPDAFENFFLVVSKIYCLGALTYMNVLRTRSCLLFHSLKRVRYLLIFTYSFTGFKPFLSLPEITIV